MYFETRRGIIYVSDELHQRLSKIVAEKELQSVLWELHTMRAGSKERMELRKRISAYLTKLANESPGQFDALLQFTFEGETARREAPFLLTDHCLRFRVGSITDYRDEYERVISDLTGNPDSFFRPLGNSICITSMAASRQGPWYRRLFRSNREFRVVLPVNSIVGIAGSFEDFQLDLGLSRVRFGPNGIETVLLDSTKNTHLGP